MSAAELDQDPTIALQQIIEAAEKLLSVMDRESAAMVQKDAVKFSALQADKEQTLETYDALVQIFQKRLGEFKNADPGRLDRLETLQKELRARAEDTQKQMDKLGSG